MSTAGKEEIVLPYGIKSLFDLEQWLRSIFSTSYEREVKECSLEELIEKALQVETEIDAEIDAQIDEYYDKLEI
jgi:hypothetical protein